MTSEHKRRLIDSVYVYCLTLLHWVADFLFIVLSPGGKYIYRDGRGEGSVQPPFCALISLQKAGARSAHAHSVSKTHLNIVLHLIQFCGFITTFFFFFFYLTTCHRTSPMVRGSNIFNNFFTITELIYE
jgi:hypothetical protein